MLGIDAPKPQVPDPTAADDPLALQPLERALDRVDRSADAADELAGMQLRARNRRQECEKARGGLATGERGERKDGHVADIETVMSISATSWDPGSWICTRRGVCVTIWCNTDTDCDTRGE